MILKNLFRRKVRTLLTVIGISIGVAAIVGLGALANGLQAGYNSIISGSQADLNPEPGGCHRPVYQRGGRSSRE